MHDSDIPKQFLLKVLAKCWDAYQEVECTPCATIVRNSPEYQNDWLLCNVDPIGHDWQNCELCQESDRRIEKHIDSFVTIASPECVRLSDRSLNYNNEGPIVRMGPDNIYGGAGWYVEMLYTVGLRCQHCNVEMPEYGAGYFISEDGSEISCWVS